MNGPNSDAAFSRRSVLQSAAKAGIGAGALLTAGAGAVQANPECAVADGDDGDATLHGDCEYEPVYEIPNGEKGRVPYVCEDASGETMLYVRWDNNWPNGFVYADEISSCER